MTGGFLIVRRDGALWGLPADDVATIERRGAANAPGATPETPGTSGTSGTGASGGLEVRFTGGRRLAVDAVLTLAGELPARPLSARLRSFLPPGSAGLALLAGEPLVLMAREGEVAHD